MLVNYANYVNLQNWFNNDTLRKNWYQNPDITTDNIREVSKVHIFDKKSFIRKWASKTLKP